MNETNSKIETNIVPSIHNTFSLEAYLKTAEDASLSNQKIKCNYDKIQADEYYTQENGYKKLR